MARLKNYLVDYTYAQQLFDTVDNNFFSDEFRDKIKSRREKYQEVNQDYIFNPYNGLCVNFAKRKLLSNSLQLFVIIIFPILALVNKKFQDDGHLYMLLTIFAFGSPIAYFIEAEILGGYEYVKYFNDFSRNSERWFKKWRILTVIFQICAKISIIVGCLLFYWLL